MVNYTNCFSLASDSNQDTLVVNFLQRLPEVEPDGSIGDATKNDLLGSFIMNRDIAINLATSILSLLNDNEAGETARE